ncbi:hypothetical protein L9F63_007896, partial [Diploptera punctata]
IIPVVAHGLECRFAKKNCHILVPSNFCFISIMATIIIDFCVRSWSNSLSLNFNPRTFQMANINMFSLFHLVSECIGPVHLLAFAVFMRHQRNFFPHV